MGKFSNCAAILLLASFVAAAPDQHGNGGGGAHNANSGGAPRQKDWNPFQNPFSFQGVSNAPAGFGTFPTFNTGGFGSGFGGFGGNVFGQPNNNNNAGGNGGGNGGSRGGSRGGAPTWGGFQDFSPVFVDFQKQFATQFPGFGFGGVAPVVAAPVDNSESPAVVAPTAASAVSSTDSTTTSTSTSTIAPVVNVQQPVSPVAGNSITVVNRNCSTEGQVIGLSQLPSDQCGSVECECFKGVYFCYSTCTPPPSGQSCTPTVPSGGSDVCPTYSGCTAQENSTTGASQIFRCNGAVHPSVCWLYEIVYGKLTEPLGFFESQSQGCPLSNQCVCGTNGFVQPAQLRQEDFKTPANNVVFPRTTPGNKGAFASS